MKGQLSNSERGQTLVWIALTLVVLLLLVGLAIDGGGLYAARRQMQNAADAGALAGAQELCFGTPTVAQAQAKALQYAGANDAEAGLTSATVVPEAPPARGGSVAVNAGRSVGLSFARLAGMDSFDVGAVAEAECGRATRLCGLLPIAFAKERWDRIPCNAMFYVLNDDTLDEIDYNICDRCICPVTNPPDGMSYILSSGNRGWVLFPRPGSQYPDPYGCMDNCGSQVGCMIEHNYPGIVSLATPPKKLCLPAQPGVVAADINAYAHRPGDITNILIWDGECGPGDVYPPDLCPGAFYPIVGTGCVEIVNLPGDSGNNWLDTIDLEPIDETVSPSDCPNNVKVAVAIKRCNCSSQCGGTDGEACNESEVCAVSLTK